MQDAHSNHHMPKMSSGIWPLYFHACLWLILASDKQMTTALPFTPTSSLLWRTLAGRLAILGLTVSHGLLLLMPTTALSKMDVTEPLLCTCSTSILISHCGTCKRYLKGWKQLQWIKSRQTWDNITLPMNNIGSDSHGARGEGRTTFILINEMINTVRYKDVIKCTNTTKHRG